VYQTFVFVSRSSLSVLHLPPIPIAYLPLPTCFQLALLLITASESATGFVQTALGGGGGEDEDGAIYATFLFIACEGLAGGSAYVNCFYHLGSEGGVDEGEGRDRDRDDLGVAAARGGGRGGSARRGSGSEGDATGAARRAGQEREFRIASVGFADTLGILVASLVASALEPALCRAQVARGRTLCKEL
jgi:battenin